MSQRAFGRLLHDLSLGEPHAPQYGGRSRVDSSTKKRFFHGGPSGFALQTRLAWGPALLAVIVAVVGGRFPANPGNTPANSSEAQDAGHDAVAVIVHNEHGVVADSEPISTRNSSKFRLERKRPRCRSPGSDGKASPSLRLPGSTRSETSRSFRTS